MKYGNIPGIDKPISRIVQGTVMVSSSKKDYSFELLDAAFEAGVNIFDTAHGYGGGDNERTVGAWINERGNRDKVVILGKGAHHNRDRERVTPYDITADLHDSLARFQTDFIDLYILHRDNPALPVGPIVDILNEHKEAGKIGVYGGSNWSAARIQEANEYAEANGLAPFVASSPNYSLADQYDVPWANCISISGKQGEADRAWYEQTQMPLFTWSSVAGGFFTGRYTRDNLDTAETGQEKLVVRCYCGEENFQRLDRVKELAAEKGVSPAQIATAYVLNTPLNIFPLIGSWTAEEVQQNVAVSELDLSADEVAWLELKQDNR